MSQRIGGFDVLKVIATILIVFHHYQQITGTFWKSGINFWGGEFYFGYLVELFFLISGFLAFRYIKRMKEGISFVGSVKGKFFRFFPLTLICAIVSTLLAHLYIIFYGNVFWKVDTYSLWTILITAIGIQAGWGIEDPMINSPTWYISVWFLCHIILYIIVYISKRIHISEKYFFVCMIFIGLGIDYYSIRLPFFNEFTSRGYFAFFYGIIMVDIVSMLKNDKREKLWYAASVLLAFIIPYLIYKRYWLVTKDEQYILTFIYYPALIFLCTSKHLCRIFNCKLIEKAGQISYNVYMWHFPLIIAMYVIISIFNLNLDCIYRIQTMFLFTIACFGVGIISFYFIEKPIEKFIKTFALYENNK